ncbi:Gti1/Pac2 family-domain-containing protein [Radiomyces spectabilis]|uniref:Gti1/Pac2 family-domain-containing protein n=1 Tax=Radiomyces spectabilis TaxID=64574 RepID=UPI002220DE84|nr:Gti1/Pac2 family-domain-containing protein [Radiomyces spectabilis]XP_051428321.1 Gti1/Pac2 family-domain-containing protein [Radiomyces spectabilis]KAI8364156.1 Gti1/Pac2 family-domain-containing protein [Radiomyces spectabilis]KAI8393788.1 Gti1/Pac2 family-domain-containing protein [Radiomyces spectabilis]
METFVGYIKTPQDALIVFEACRRGQLSRVQRRLSSKERLNIRSGSVFAWDEREAGMRRWTDGRTWSPSRVLGSFLTYRELDTKRRPRRPSSSCSYKSGGLIKQSFSICTATNQKIHLISYYTKADIAAGRLTQPSQHPLLSHIKVPKGLYPELNPLDTSGGHSATLHNLRQDLSYVTDLASPSFQPMMMPAQPPLLVQDINWCNLSSSEDKRQLQALQGQLRL